MKNKEQESSAVNDYIARFSPAVQKSLRTIRATIQKAAPEAEEIISYGVPAYKLNGVLVYFAAFKNHIGFYPRASAIRKFASELSDYKSAKGSVQFPLDEAIPSALISRMVKFRVKENLVS